MTLKRTERMVNSAMALESMRDLGITLQQGLTEMADNAIDAGCRRLAIHLDAHENGHLRIIVADDGIGVPMAHPSQPEVKQTLRHVLRFGGRIPHVGRHHPIGRFGFGLSQAITCLTLRTTVYSKTSGQPWRSAVYDFEHLKANDALLMDEGTDLPLAEDEHNGVAFVPADSGTVIVMEDVDRADWQNVKRLKPASRRTLAASTATPSPKGSSSPSPHVMKPSRSAHPSLPATPSARWSARPGGNLRARHGARWGRTHPRRRGPCLRGRAHRPQYRAARGHPRPPLPV